MKSRKVELSVEISQAIGALELLMVELSVANQDGDDQACIDDLQSRLDYLQNDVLLPALDQLNLLVRVCN